jgi:hypothetical protein
MRSVANPRTSDDAHSIPPAPRQRSRSTSLAQLTKDEAQLAEDMRKLRAKADTIRKAKAAAKRREDRKAILALGQLAWSCGLGAIDAALLRTELSALATRLTASTPEPQS